MARLLKSIQADKRGRISLGQAYAHMSFLVETEGDVIIFRPARVIAEGEAWLYENEEALSRVRKGLIQARRRQFARNPTRHR